MLERLTVLLKRFLDEPSDQGRADFLHNFARSEFMSGDRYSDICLDHEIAICYICFANTCENVSPFLKEIIPVLTENARCYL